MTTSDECPLALTCPYCGGALHINLQRVGPSYLEYETPESIECLSCDATWEPNGDARDAAKWIQYPGVYDRPDAVGKPERPGGDAK